MSTLLFWSSWRMDMGRSYLPSVSLNIPASGCSSVFFPVFFGLYVSPHYHLLETGTAAVVAAVLAEVRDGV